MAIREADDIQLGPWGTDGGVRYDLAVEDVSETEISSMENMRINSAGAVETRLGTKSYKDANNDGFTTTLTL